MVTSSPPRTVGAREKSARASPPGNTADYVVAIPIGYRPQGALRHENIDVGKAFAVGAVTDKAADGAGLSQDHFPAQGQGRRYRYNFESKICFHA